MAEDNYFN